MKVNKNSFKVGEPLKKGGKSSKKKISPIQALKNVFDKIPKAVESKNEDAFHEFKEKFNKMKVQTKPLKMRVDIKVQEQKQQKILKAQQQKKTKSSFHERMKLRSLSQASHNNDLKKAKMEKEKQKVEQEQKKAQRLKEIGKRKQELLQKLKKIDQELNNAKREGSPIYLEKSLTQSKANQSFFKNQSRLSPKNQEAYNVSQHSKAVQMLERINKDKIKRQQKIAQDLKKKQLLQLQKINEIEKKKNKEYEERRNRELRQIRLPKIPFNKDKNIKIHETANLQKHTSMLPTTLQNTAKQRKKSEDSLYEEHFDDDNFSRNRLETQRQEMIAKLKGEKNENQILEKDGSEVNGQNQRKDEVQNEDSTIRNDRRQSNKQNDELMKKNKEEDAYRNEGYQNESEKFYENENGAEYDEKVYQNVERQDQKQNEQKYAEQNEFAELSRSGLSEEIM